MSKNYDNYILSIAELMKQNIYFSDKEFNFLTISNTNWITRKNRTSFNHEKDLTPRRIIFMDFGHRYSPELAYTHPALIIGKKNNFLLVLPISSSPNKVSVAYHPTINPNGNKKYYLLKSGEGGLASDSVVILTEILTISYGRIISLYSLNGINQSDYINIRKMSFANNFPNESRRMYNLEKENSEQKEVLKNLLDKELVSRYIITYLNENIDIQRCLKGVYGRLEYDIHIDTSKIGIKNYNIVLIDDFNNRVEKTLTVEVLESKRDNEIIENKELETVQ